MAKHVMKVDVHHNGHKLCKGEVCPQEHVSAMVSQGLAEEFLEPVQPKEPKPSKAKAEK